MKTKKPAERNWWLTQHFDVYNDGLSRSSYFIAHKSLAEAKYNRVGKRKIIKVREISK